MENKGKTVVVYYVNVGNLDDKDVESYVDKYSKKISLKSEVPNIVELYIPSRNREDIETFYVE